MSDLHALGKALRHESASTAKGRKGKKDIVKGLGLIASAYSSLRADVLAVHGGDVPASEVSAAQATDKKGRTKLIGRSEPAQGLIALRTPAPSSRYGADAVPPTGAR